MTRDHDALRDLLAPVALGAAHPREVRRVEAHAAECAVCREELAGMRQAVDVLSVAVPQVEPPSRLRAAVMQTVRAEAAARVPEAAPALSREGRTGRRRLLPRPSILRSWPALAAVATVAALLLGWNIALQTGADPGRDEAVATVPVRGTEAAPGITGRVVYVPSEDTAVVRLYGLPALPRGEAYQLWVIRDGSPRSAGLLEPVAAGAAEAVASGVAGADAVAVTAQPRTSRVTPEGPILVEAPLATG